MEARTTQLRGLNRDGASSIKAHRYPSAPNTAAVRVSLTGVYLDRGGAVGLTANAQQERAAQSVTVTQTQERSNTRRTCLLPLLSTLEFHLIPSLQAADAIFKDGLQHLQDIQHLQHLHKPSHLCSLQNPPTTVQSLHPVLLFLRN